MKGQPEQRKKIMHANIPPPPQYGAASRQKCASAANMRPRCTYIYVHVKSPEAGTELFDRQLEQETSPASMLNTYLSIEMLDI